MRHNAQQKRETEAGAEAEHGLGRHEAVETDDGIDVSSRSTARLKRTSDIQLGSVEGGILWWWLQAAAGTRPRGSRGCNMRWT